jgi:vacuolar-type H+-ATPase subunit F/Vma7
MQIKKLLIIADEQTVQLFRLVGAVGFTVQNHDLEHLPHQLQPAITYVRSHASEIGGVLVAAPLASTLIERLDRIKTLEVPVIRLPDENGQSQIGFLEALMEKAIGMKLERNGSL